MSTEYIERGAEPKPRYIDINAFFASENINNVYGDYWELKERLDEVPAAEVEPVVHAHWEGCELFGWKYYKCTNCGETISGFPLYPYCHNCGAHMCERSEHED